MVSFNCVVVSLRLRLYSLVEGVDLVPRELVQVHKLDLVVVLKEAE